MIEQAEGGLRVTAPMVIANARALHEAGRRALSSAQRSASVLLDLAGVAEVDSSALATLFAWQRKAAESAVQLRVANPPASLISLAALYGVSELLPLA
ncbi:MAG: putative NTP binding protein (contains STAS domain) [Candidatus Accumulibacter regalis]|uniref:NTP binding protein (Contains STAS domain) n=1 Tax=Accumulibacter regalis TaxID=522306 RepID=A0A011Q7Y1_ACCRE|nr:MULTISPECIES: STAS domain-containing protein [unclassified Candidatus Accumulibacter]EXI85265.1 MAG: putative NTP binding protein (contains STAS domain) [Candidatus Accumulibacter regalis]HRE71109.1 STAS domain-containing protein [Accumulibacter sp.]HRI90784.1 STAS domain-containing protein [Accumulibacter sp.]